MTDDYKINRRHEDRQPRSQDIETAIADAAHMLSVMPDRSPVDLGHPDSLVNGRILVTSATYAALTRRAAELIAQHARGPIIGIPVVEVPDVGFVDVGAGLVACVSVFDRHTIYVLPREQYEAGVYSAPEYKYQPPRMSL